MCSESSTRLPPREDRPREDRPREDRPREDRPREDRPREDRLDALRRHPDLWCAGDVGRDTDRTIATGFPLLDECLPGGGWPRSAMVEILHGPWGIGELRLLLPALSALSRDFGRGSSSEVSGGGRLLACVAPPHRLCVPALKAHGVPPSSLLVVDACNSSEAFWASEQALRSGACGAVLLWLQAHGDVPAVAAPSAQQSTNALSRALRRLQLAAETGKALGVVFRGLDAVSQPSPAALRLVLHTGPGDGDPGDGKQPCLELLKTRGGRRRRIPLARLGASMLVG